MGKTSVDNSKNIQKATFIKLLAAESGFTLGDTKIFWKSFEDVLAKILANNQVLTVPRFGKIFVTEAKVKDGKGWDQVHKRYFDKKPYKIITFRASDSLKSLMLEYQKMKQYENDIEKE